MRTLVVLSPSLSGRVRRCLRCTNHNYCVTAPTAASRENDRLTHGFLLPAIQLFPIYFAWSALALALQLLTGKTLGLPAKAMRWLAASLAAALINSLFLEPASTKVMFQRYALEKQNRREEAEYRELAKRFGALHGASSMVNLVTVVGGFVHAYYLSLML